MLKKDLEMLLSCDSTDSAPRGGPTGDPVSTTSTALSLFPELTASDLRVINARLKNKRYKRSKKSPDELYEEDLLALEKEEAVQKSIERYLHVVDKCKKSFRTKFVKQKRKNELPPAETINLELLQDAIPDESPHRHEQHEIINRARRRHRDRIILKYTKHDLRKKIRNKILACDIAMNLALSNPNSRMHSSYMNTISFCQSQYEQDGFRLKSKYCNARHCYSCNRIRCGKLMNNYKPFIEWMAEDMHMVTLTIPNIAADDLYGSVREMIKAFQRIKDLARKDDMNFIGLRKMECTYNIEANTYHPHFHILVKGYTPAKFLYYNWMDEFPGANPVAQDIRQANVSSAMELFKYFTKFWSKKKNNTDTIIDYKAQDVIYNAISGSRIFQPFGMQVFKLETQITIDESEEIAPEQEIHFNIPARNVNFNYDYESQNYLDPDTGELLIDFKLNKKDLKLLQALNASVVDAGHRINFKNVMKPPEEKEPDPDYLENLKAEYSKIPVLLSPVRLAKVYARLNKMQKGANILPGKDLQMEI